jgi:hypothetical protein
MNVVIEAADKLADIISHKQFNNTALSGVIEVKLETIITGSRADKG